MPLHITLPVPHRPLQNVPRADVRSTCFTLSAAGSGSPGTDLATMLARTFVCSKRRVLCVTDPTRKRNGAHDRSLLASEFYDALREIEWYSYHHCLPFLPDLLSLTPRLQQLTVGALFDTEAPIDDVVPECPQLPETAYTFSLTSLHCSAVLSAEVISRIVSCSVHTLRDLHLLIHGSEFDRLAPKLPPLPALRTLALLQADGLVDRALIAQFLRSCPRLVSLTVATEDPHGSDGVHIWASSSPHLRALKVHATYRYWSLGAVQVFQRALEHWTRLRSLELVVREEHRKESLEAALRRVCASKRIALRMTRIYRQRLNWDALSGVVPVGYGNTPLV
ncbi:hypothetical protein AURDEDRAFT_172454 [Auricularia subglabra TFB-10046 SS5]|nr:hypothetical protein AURDEDRAFT_172454 [Auricularia subglabra TFB-10046 SS5]